MFTQVRTRLVTFLLAALIISTEAFRCPHPDLIHPCVCNSASVSLTCHTTSSIDLRSIFANFRYFDKQMRRFFLAGHRESPALIYQLDEDVFGDMQFEEISIKHTTLKRIHSNVFERTSNYTKSIYLTDNYLSSIVKDEFDLFAALGKLSAVEKIRLDRNRLTEIPSRAFLSNDQLRLRHISLVSNGIREIGDHAFYGLPALEFLNLENNRVKNVTDLSFAFTPSVEEIRVSLYLNNLAPEVFPANAFANVNRPVKLNLELNERFKTLPESVFRELLSYDNSEVRLGGRVQCDCQARWLIESEKELKDRVHGSLWCDSDPKVYFWSVSSETLANNCSQSDI